MTSSSDIRKSFLDFFESKAHSRQASGPLVLPSDPTLMFANAGMVPFKDVFTGKETRAYTRATTSQKCIRISGKHNDLENVGVTARHHTFFEMLGNFSFGDYFKEDAIKFAWEFITEHMKLDLSRIVITVFGGEEGYGPEDTEAARIWREVTGFPEERIIRENAKENFWSMGDTGPCGPCTEIHYYLGDGEPDPSTFGEEPTPDGKGWFEFWNLVFMQFNREVAGGPLEPLPAPSVDTGMGLERLAVIKQGVLSNYDTDLLRPLVNLASEISGKPYGGTQGDDDMSMRVIADHARTIAFLISEGVFPDKGKKEYVARRVARRAIRHGHRLGINELFFHRCTDKVVELMGEAYPQLVERRELIADLTRSEEERFRRTLANGLRLLDENEDWDHSTGVRTLPGRVAFKLFDTYGFPLDLQRVIGEEQSFSIDEVGFARELKDAKDRSKGSVIEGAVIDDVYRPILALGATDFVGYEHEDGRSEIIALLSRGERTSSLTPFDPETSSEAEPPHELITRLTPFYAEKGGQAGDVGVIESGASRFVVTDTVIPLDGLYVHKGYLAQGALNEGDEVHLRVDHNARSATRRNHSATHLLHWALREVIGQAVTQKGSLVSSERLRFDYSSARALTAGEVSDIEDLVNDAILQNTDVVTEVLPMDDAKQRGAIGIFEEKYGDVVRMLRIGPSLELCGGTHAFRTGDIGLFKILSDGGLSAGVRRIEATTGFNALAHLRAVERELGNAAQLLKAPPMLAADKVKKTLDKQRELQREIEKLQKELISGSGSGNDLTAEAREIAGVHVLGTTVPVGDPKTLREMADQLRDKLAPAVIMLGAPSKDGKKAILVCSVSREITDRFKAGDLVRGAAKIVGGGGGGRPDFAQAGGSDPTRLEDAVASVYGAIEA